MMKTLQKLPLLQDFSMDIVNFPQSCYDYHKYFQFDPIHSKCTFYRLKDIHLHLGNKEMLKYKALTENNLYEWIKHHKYIKKIAIKVIDYEDWALLDENARIINRDRTEYKKRFTLTYRDRLDIQQIICKFIQGIMENQFLHESLDKFYFHDELSGIYDYQCTLIKLFSSCKLQQIEWIHLSFRCNCMINICCI